MTATTAAGASSPVTTADGARASSSRTKSKQIIESWDGTELATTFFTPKAAGPHPAVLMTHGWGSTRTSPLTRVKAENYAKNGYAVLTYDSRGFGKSSGTVEMNGPKETKDAQHLVTWLANRPEVATEAADNPWLGMDGVSYAGGIQYQLDAVDHRLDAMIPRITWNDLEYSLAPNGVIKIGWLSALLGLGSVGTILDGDAEITDDLYDWYWYALEENDIPPGATEVFEDRAVSPADLETPVFLMGGWNDTLFNPGEALASYEALRDAGIETRLCLYEGGHDLSEVTVSFSDRGRMNSQALDWMDRHVRGLESDVPAVQEYLPQRETWREDGQWPPEDVAQETYALSDAGVDGSHDIEQTGWWNWSGDDTVTYEWTAQEDIEVVGQPEITLTVDVHGPEARLFFELEHDGDAVNGMTEAYRLPYSGTQTIQFTYPGIQRFVSAGDTIGLSVSVSDTWHLDSRTGEGVTIDPHGSSLTLPQRPDDGHSGGDEDDDDCWLLCT